MESLGLIGGGFHVRFGRVEMGVKKLELEFLVII